MKVYILGPMSNIPNFNFPAFRAAAADLRARGYEVLSPAELDEAEGFEPSPTGDDQPAEQYAAFLARDIQRIAEEGVDAGVALEGWETSGGAQTEVAFLRALGKPILAYPSLDPVGEVDGRPVTVSADGYAPVGANPKDALAASEKRTPLDLLEPAANEQIAWALDDGRTKYGLRNYVEAPVRLRVYLGAMLRHIDAMLAGEDNAQDSGRHHLAHVGANVHIVLASAAAGTLVDDR